MENAPKQAAQTGEPKFGWVEGHASPACRPDELASSTMRGKARRAGSAGSPRARGGAVPEPTGAEAARLAAIVESSDDAIIGKNLDGTIVSWNAGAERMYGYAAAEVVGKSIAVLTPPGSADEIAQLLDQLQRGERVEHYETLRRRKDGGLVRVSLTISPVRDAAGRIIGASSIARDVTARHVQEQEIRRRARLYQALSHVNQAIVHATDRPAMLQAVCRELAEHGEFRLVWIGEHDAAQRRLQPVAAAGPELGFLEGLVVWTDDRADPRTPSGIAVRGQRAVVCDDLAAEAGGPEWRERMRRHGFQSAAALPITLAGRGWGNLTVYAPEPGCFRDQEVALLQEVASDVSFALAHLEQREHHQQLATIVEASEDAVVSRTLDGRILTWNRGAERIYGYPAAEAVGRPITMLIPPGRESEFERFNASLRRGESTRYFETARRRKDGSEIAVAVTVSPLRDGENRIVGAASIARDITDRKQAAEELRLAHARLRRLVDANIVGIVIADAAGHVLEANDYFLDLIGVNRAELDRGHVDWRALTPAEWLPADERALGELRERGTCAPYEKEYRRRDGTRVPVLLTDALLPGPEGQIAAFVLDLTERNRAAEALRTNEERYRSLFENMLNGFAYCRMIYDGGRPVDFVYLAVNRAFETLTGLKGVVGRKVSEVIPGIAEADPGLIATYGRVAQGGKPETIVTYVTALAMWFSISVYSPEKDHFVAVFDVITERMEAERKLRLFRELIERSSDAIEVIDPDTGRFLDVNETACRMLGYSREELLARTIFDVDHDLHSAAFEARSARLAGGGMETIETRHWRKDGTSMPVEASISPVTLDRPYRVAIVRDITGRKQLEEEHRVQVAALNAAANAIAITNPQGTIEWANAAFAALSGYNAAESIGHNPRELVRSGLQDRAFYQRMWDTILAGRVWQGEVVNRRKDGSRYAEEMTITPVRDGSGAIAHFIAIKQDISERKRAEEELRLHKAVLEETGMIAKVGGWSFDVRTGEGFWSDEVSRIHDLDPRQPTSRDFGLQFYAGASRARIEAALKEAIEQGRSYDLELELVTAKGAHKWVRTIGHPVLEDGRVVRVHGSFQDITERRLAGERIREQAALLDGASDAIYVTALDCTILYWNPAAERIYGWSAAEAMGRTTAELNAAGENLAADALATTLKDGAWTGERRQRTKAGPAVDVLSRLTLMRDDRGGPRSILVINTDITEKKRLEERFLRAQRLESLGALASGIAHDLNNVLAPIMMSVPLLRDSVRDETARTLVAMVETSAKRGADIVRQVLTFARGSEGERIALQPKHLVRDMVKMAEQTFPKNIQVENQSGADIWMVEGDVTQLHQALMNLCVNARDAMPDGGRLILGAENVTVDAARAAQMPGAAAGRFVRLRVSDTGMGIPPAVQTRMFEPFFTTKSLGKGTGLGLSTVLGIIKGHGGFIQLDSQVGRGTVFDLYFPAATTAPATRVSAAPGTNPPWPRADGELVLVVDDEAAIRAVARQALEEFGYRVLLCATGAEAVQMFRVSRAEVRLVITDMMMPEMDGPTLVRALREVDPEVKVVGITGVADVATMEQLPALALSALLTKPFTIGQLLDAVHIVLAPRAQKAT
jgi:PAS domain S-box-containing protein